MCYGGSAFKIFASDYGFEHHTSSPRMSQNNDLAVVNKNLSEHKEVCEDNNNKLFHDKLGQNF